MTLNTFILVDIASHVRAKAFYLAPKRGHWRPFQLYSTNRVLYLGHTTHNAPTMTRRQRRAAVAHGSPANDKNNISSASDIPMVRPSPSSSSKPKASKTLYEIAAERQAELSSQGQPFPRNTDIGLESKATKLITLTPDGTISENPTEDPSSFNKPAEEAPLPLLDTLLLSLPLSFLHFTLAFLTLHQYGQTDPNDLRNSLLTLLKQTLLVAFPTLTLLIYVAHGHALPFLTSKKKYTLAIQTARTIVYTLTATIAGSYLIHLTNDRGYYAVMKRAPAIGTLWVWCIIELGLVGAVVGVVGPGVFAWWRGYSVL